MLRLFLALIFFCGGRLAAQQALLWIPGDLRDSEQIIAALEADKDLRLTAAFSELPKGLEERIIKLESEGRLELALRPAGDPPLPLLYYPALESVTWEGKTSTSAMTNDQYFLALRLGLAKEAAFKALKKNPAGLVSPPGGLASDYFPLAKALGLKWLACGPLVSTQAAVLEAGGVYAVPFFKFSASTPAAGNFLLFDETGSEDPAALRALLAAELKAAVPSPRLTVSEALKLAPSTAAAPGEIAALSAPWSGDYTQWASSPTQAGALAAFAKARADLMLHLNSFQGNYKPAAPAFNEYFAAEDGAKLRELGAGTPEQAGETEIEIQSALANAYRIMKKTPPPWLFSSLADAALAGEKANKPVVKISSGGFEIANTDRKPEIPARTLLPKNSDPYNIWKLVSFSVDATPEELVFRFFPRELDNIDREPSGFSHIRLDLYIDINHRPRAGMARPLAGRPLRLFPENAWEYALEITPDRVSFYKVTPKGPSAAGTFMPKAEGGAVTVRVPRTVLKGNPLLWGYAALLLAPKEGGGFMLADSITADISNGYIYAIRPGGN